MATPHIGAQFIIFGKQYNIEEDINIILDQLAAAGYAAIEGSIKDPVDLRRKLIARGMVLGGLHTVPRVLMEKLPEQIDFMKKAKCYSMCNSGCLDWKHTTLPEVENSIKIINEAGKKLREAGIRLHYHNHDFEFTVQFNGKRIIDIMLEQFDPKAVDLCVDVAWVRRGGDDPAAFLKKHASRIGYLHFKDFEADSDGKFLRWVELGTGAVDYRAILPALPLLKDVQFAMVEQDQPNGNAMLNMINSRAFLRSLGL